MIKLSSITDSLKRIEGSMQEISRFAHSSDEVRYELFSFLRISSIGYSGKRKNDPDRIQEKQ